MIRLASSFHLVSYLLIFSFLVVARLRVRSHPYPSRATSAAYAWPTACFLQTRVGTAWITLIDQQFLPNNFFCFRFFATHTRETIYHDVKSPEICADFKHLLVFRQRTDQELEVNLRTVEGIHRIHAGISRGRVTQRVLSFVVHYKTASKAESKPPICLIDVL